jgi:hypothetical protein
LLPLLLPVLPPLLPLVVLLLQGGSLLTPDISGASRKSWMRVMP